MSVPGRPHSSSLDKHHAAGQAEACVSQGAGCGIIWAHVISLETGDQVLCNQP